MPRRRPFALNLSAMLAPMIRTRRATNYAGSSPYVNVDKLTLDIANLKHSQESEDNSSPIRALFATDNIDRGEVIASLPMQTCVLGASTAHSIVLELGGQDLYKRLLKLDILGAFQRKNQEGIESRRTAEFTESLPPFSTRDGVMMTAALALAKEKEPSESSCGGSSDWLVHWSRALPPSYIQNLGVSLVSHTAKKCVPLERREVKQIVGCDGVEQLQLYGRDEGSTHPRLPIGSTVVSLLQPLTSSSSSLVESTPEEHNTVSVTKSDADDCPVSASNEGVNSVNRALGVLSVPNLSPEGKQDQLQRVQRKAAVQSLSYIEAVPRKPPGYPESDSVVIIESNEAVISPSISLDFFRGSTLKLSENKQRAGAAKNIEENAAFAQLRAMKATLEDVMLEPMAHLMVSAGCHSTPRELMDDDEICDTSAQPASSKSREEMSRFSHIMANLHWAHSMLRSRCVNAAWRNTDPMYHNPAIPLCLPVLAPLVDLINHDPISCNVTFQLQVMPDTGSRRGPQQVSQSNPLDHAVLVVSATRKIEVGEPLTMNYGHYRQRQILFDKSPLDAAEEILSYRLKGVAQRDQANLIAAAEMKDIESAQRYDTRTLPGEQRVVLQSDMVIQKSRVVDDGALNRSTARRLQTPPTNTLRDALDRAIRGSEIDSRTIKAKKGEAMSDAEWLWNFGFLKSIKEKEQEAKGLWHADLRTRIQRMTDVRRKGRKGEFVVGVPEAMSSLQAQRAMLEKARYGGT